MYLVHKYQLGDYATIYRPSTYHPLSKPESSVDLWSWSINPEPAIEFRITKSHSIKNFTCPPCYLAISRICQSPFQWSIYHLSTNHQVFHTLTLRNFPPRSSNVPTFLSASKSARSGKLPNTCQQPQENPEWQSLRNSFQPAWVRAMSFMCSKSFSSKSAQILHVVFLSAIEME